MFIISTYLKAIFIILNLLSSLAMMQYEPTPKLKSLDEYIAIGFDADHCIIKYELRELIRITYESISKSVCDSCKYPYEAIKFDTKTDYQYLMNNLIIDLVTHILRWLRF